MDTASLRTAGDPICRGPSVNHARQIARHHGLRLWKPRDGSRAAWEYGPLALIDPDTNAWIARGLRTVEDVATTAEEWSSQPA